MYSAISANKRNTILIMAAFVGIVGAVGWAISYYYGNTSITWVVLAVAIVYALIQYFAASKIATSMTGAHRIEKKDNPRLYRIVENLTITTGMPMPKVYVIDDPAPNAFATGRNPEHAVVAATTGLLDVMEDRELEAVMAHEISHVRNYDIRVSMIAFGLVAAIGLLSELAMYMFFFGRGNNNNGNPLIMIVGIILIILAPIIAAVVQMAVSRQREYLADASGSMTTRDTEGLAMALEKLGQYGRPMKHQNSASAHLFISNPLKKSFFSNLFSTHPPLEERIERLRKNADKF